MTAHEVAQWMHAELQRDRCLYQEAAVYDIAAKFGEEFTYCNQNGNLAIRRDVLGEFRKLTSGSVVWVRSERAWRKREPFDTPGKRQTE